MLETSVGLPADVGQSVTCVTGLRAEIKDANSEAGFLVAANNCVYEAPRNSVVMCTYCVTATNCNRTPGVEQ